MDMRPYVGGEFAMGAGRRNEPDGIKKVEPDLAQAEIARLHGLVGDWQAYGDRATTRIAELEAEVAQLRRQLAERDGRKRDGVTVERDARGVTGDTAKRKAAERARRYRERKKQAAHGV